MTSEVSEQAVSVGRPFTLTVTITGRDATDAGEPILEPMPDFIVELIGTSRNISIINLNSTITLTYTYSVEAKMVGTFDVGAATVTIGGKTFSAAPTSARARASQMCSDLGASGRESMRVTDRLIWSLVARPEPVRACLISAGDTSRTRAPV